MNGAWMVALALFAPGDGPAPLSEDFRLRYKALAEALDRGALDGFGEALHGGTGLQRRALLALLRRHEVPGATALVLERLGDVDAQVRAAALESLRRQARPEDAPAVRARLADRDPRVRDAALATLATLATPADLEPHLAELGVERWRTRELMRRALVEASGVLDPYADELTVEEGRRAEAWWRAWFRRWRGARPEAWLAEAARDARPRARGLALRRLGTLDWRVAVPPLLEGLGDPVEGVRDQAYRALVHAVHLPLSFDAAAGTDVRVAQVAAWKEWWGRAQGGPARDYLVRALGHESARVRAAAARELARFGDATSAAPLVEALGDAASGVRAEAYASLQTLLGPPAAGPQPSLAFDPDGAAKTRRQAQLRWRRLVYDRERAAARAASSQGGR